MGKFPTEIVPVVILTGGRATRMQPLTDVIPKPLIPIAGVPLIKRILRDFRSEGFIKFIIVLSPNSDVIQKYVLDVAQEKPNLSIEFVTQKEPKGMVDAIQCAKKLTEKAMLENSRLFHEYNLSPFFILSAVDVLLDRSDLSEFINAHVKSNPACSLAVYKSDDVTMSETHGNIKLEREKVVDIVEKPGVNKKIDDYYSLPLYIFTHRLMDYLDKVGLSSRKELELPSAIKLMLSDNLPIQGTHLCRSEKITSSTAGKYHLTYIKDLLQFTFRFLHEEPFEFTGEYPTLIEPIVAKSCEIGDSVLIGPKVYIDKGCKIGDFTEISQSILLGNNKIGNKAQIENAIIGWDVIISDGSIVKDTLVMEDRESHEI
jgi:NDP-sugar pyrophosphorylase family protein